jgi:predicted RNase H-like nuclease (RuvC/YqgF family)
MFVITEESLNRSRSGEKSGMQRCESAFKKFDKAFKRNIQVRNQTAERIKEIAKRNHEACETAKREQQKQEKERSERKAAKEKRLSEIEAKLNVMFYGFENVKKASDELINKVDSITDRMETVLNDVVMMREECEAKDAEILQLHSRLNQQEKEIETLKRMLNEQREMMEMYADINSMNLNRIMNSRPF